MTNGTASEEAARAWEIWKANQPKDFFAADAFLQRQLESSLGRSGFAEVRSELEDVGRVSATELDKVTAASSEIRNLPVLDRYDSLGTRTEAVMFHPSYHRAGELIRSTGILGDHLRPNGVVLQVAKAYLLSFNGECGHICPVACTIGIIRALSELGNDDLKTHYLERLLDSDYRAGLHGAQYLTELQGGSDVGSNSCSAEPVDAPQGLWKLTGSKWFCSNVTADLALVTARPSGSSRDTAGLGLFLLPRLVDKGHHNSYRIRRLKNKLGTQSLATAEIDLEGALAYQLGPIEKGFANMMKYAISVSRLFNCVLSCAAARRASIVATSYTAQRMAFGVPIRDFSMVQRSVCEMQTTSDALVSGLVRLAVISQRLQTEEATSDEKIFYRVMLSISKSFMARAASKVVAEAMNCLGGNAVVEDFSPLPRLFRDCVVYENWEGTKNVLLTQSWRDLSKPRALDAFFRCFDGIAESADLSSAGITSSDVRSLQGGLRDRVERQLEQEAGPAFEECADSLAEHFLQLSMCVPPSREEQASDSPSQELCAASISSFWNRRPKRDQLEDPDYPRRIRAHAALVFGFLSRFGLESKD